MKILFRVYTAVYILLYLFITFSPEMLKLYGIWEMVDIVVMGTALTGMVASTFGIRILVKRFWEYFFYLFIIYEFLYMSWLQLPLLEKLHLTDQMAMSNMVNVFMMLPVGFSLFRLQQRWDILFVKTNEKKSGDPQV
jgi:hypothetical protein